MPAGHSCLLVIQHVHIVKWVIHCLCLHFVAAASVQDPCPAHGPEGSTAVLATGAINSILLCLLAGKHVCCAGGVVMLFGVLQGTEHLSCQAVACVAEQQALDCV